MKKSTVYAILSVFGVIAIATLVFSFVATGFSLGKVMATALVVASIWSMVYFVSKTA